MKNINLTSAIKSFTCILSLLLFAACQNSTQAQTATADVVDDPVAVATTPPATKKIKLAILLDTSGSMSGLIEQAKSQLWNIVNELAKAEHDGLKPELEMALYQYGNDGLSAREGYIQMVSPLTNDLDQISADLFALSTNGGSEFCGHVIQTSLNQLDWAAGQEDYKVIFIAGNEAFTQGNIAYDVVCKDAKERGIVVNTIFCGDFQAGINTSWKDGADLAGGKYFSIDHNSKTEFIDSPYDDEIAELNTRLNTTYIAYGSRGVQKKALMEQQDENAKVYGSANATKRAVAKSSSVYKSKSWDLVEASKEKDFDIDKLEEDTLPAEMQGKTTEEKNQIIAEKENERASIKAKILELNKKREAYVVEQRKGKAANQLDNAIVSAIRLQAKNRQFTFPQS
jgi:hypothetical protein